MNSSTLSRSFFTNVQLAALAVVLSFTFVCMMVPTPARAAGLTEDQVKAVVSLLESFNADQATLVRVQKALGGPGFMASSTIQKQHETGARPLCELLKRELRRGSKGDDVRELQKLLAQDKDVYVEGEITGFFGERTEAAVKRLQAKLGIVSVGDAASTGYGMVGAKTRAALLARCSSGDKVVFKVSPLSGKAPLTVQFKVDHVKTNDGTYTIEFGDGTRATQTEAKHTYNTVGTYLAKLMYTIKNNCAIATSTECVTQEDKTRIIGTAVIKVGEKKTDDRSGRSHLEDDDVESDEDEDDTVSYKPSTASVLLASAATSMTAPFNLVTNVLSDAFILLGLY